MSEQDIRATPAGPLDGIRVLDLTAVVLGPLATQVLADFGADVIKIEGPEGDLMRANGVSQHAGMSSIYLALNRNKRSVVLDLKTPEGAEALRGLIASADVLVHNMRVAAIERLGFGYAEVARINPRIVYCVATGFGQDGPHRDKPAFDDIIQAGCGLVALGSTTGDRPEYVPSLIADKTTGLALANAVLAALLYRERKGVGQSVEVPMLETMTAFVMAEHLGGLTFEPAPAGAGYARLLQGGRRPRRPRRWICALPYTERHWQAFFRAVGRDDLAERYEVADRAQRNANIRALYGHLAELTPRASPTNGWRCSSRSTSPPRRSTAWMHWSTTRTCAPSACSRKRSTPPKARCAKCAPPRASPPRRCRCAAMRQGWASTPPKSCRSWASRKAPANDNESAGDRHEL